MGAADEIPQRSRMQREVEQPKAARRAYCVIVTGERRFYGFVFKKGVLGPKA